MSASTLSEISELLYHHEPKLSGFGVLPAPILKKVFVYVHSGELVKYVSLVCKHWRRVVMQPDFVRSLNVSGEAMPLSYIYDHIRKYSHLNGLHLDNVDDPKPILIQAYKLRRPLQKFTMKNCTVNMNVLKYAINKFPGLQSLNLEHTSFIGMPPDYSIISSLITLRSLNITKITDITMHDILETILNCKCLEELDIGLLPSKVDLIDDDACLIITNIGAKLKLLRIDARSLTSRTFEKLLECPNLTSLFINYAVNLTGAFMVDFWKRFPNIEQFGFSHNCIITGDDIKSIFKYPETCTAFSKITCLDFTHCSRLGDTGTEAISYCCKSLQKIHLKSCKSVSTIRRLCKHCRDLRTLDVAFCVNLKLTFRLPKRLEEIVIHESEQLERLKRRLSRRQGIRMYVALSEYTDELKRL